MWSSTGAISTIRWCTWKFSHCWTRGSSIRPRRKPICLSSTRKNMKSWNKRDLGWSSDSHRHFPIEFVKKKDNKTMNIANLFFIFFSFPSSPFFYRLFNNTSCPFYSSIISSFPFVRFCPALQKLWFCNNSFVSTFSHCLPKRRVKEKQASHLS